jgi:hypothetical protein
LVSAELISETAEVKAVEVVPLVTVTLDILTLAWAPTSTTKRGFSLRTAAGMFSGRVTAPVLAA